jgi:tRNA modification GTPase
MLLQGNSGEQLSGLINDRQRSALLAAAEALNSAAENLRLCFDADMLSIDVQTAWQALAEISGQAAADDIIERVFSRFCLGK